MTRGDLRTRRTDYLTGLKLAEAVIAEELERRKCSHLREYIAEAAIALKSVREAMVRRTIADANAHRSAMSKPGPPEGSLT